MMVGLVVSQAKMWLFLLCLSLCVLASEGKSTTGGKKKKRMKQKDGESDSTLVKNWTRIIGDKVVGNHLHDGFHNANDSDIDDLQIIQDKKTKEDGETPAKPAPKEMRASLMELVQELQTLDELQASSDLEVKELLQTLHTITTLNDTYKIKNQTLQTVTPKKAKQYNLTEAMNAMEFSQRLLEKNRELSKNKFNSAKELSESLGKMLQARIAVYEVMEEELTQLKSDKETRESERVDYESGAILSKDGAVRFNVDTDNGKSGAYDPAILQEDFLFLTGLFILLFSAMLGGIGMATIGLPTFVGFILAGLVVGPNCFGWIQHLQYIEILSQIGGPLLLINQGLGYGTINVRGALQARHMQIQAPLSLVDSLKCNGPGINDLQNSGLLWFLVLVIACFAVGLHCLGFGQDGHVNLFLEACCVAVASSTVAGQSSPHRNNRTYGFQAIVKPYLFVQEVLTGFLLCLPNALSRGVWGILIVARELFFLCLFVYLTLYAAVSIMPKVAPYVVKSDIPELFVLAMVGLCLGSAAVTHEIGIGPEVGALASGLMLTQTVDVRHALAVVDPIKNVFATVLFASIGLLISPVFVAHHAIEICKLLLLTVFLKCVLWTAYLYLKGHSRRDAFLSSCCLAQIAEFAILVLGQGLRVGVISRIDYLLFLATTVLSLVIAPLHLKFWLWILQPPWTEAKGKDGGVYISDHVSPNPNHAQFRTLSSVLHQETERLSFA
eukprot:gb/GEZN01001298.1/.p1 GENE.gb/GEZN01001298.1/~~gb/GEZN01001298.1/.p1  ORF type:complete len:725 (-),score=87.29 gb/GEZN01001298.1/:26-2200(-)